MKLNFAFVIASTAFLLLPTFSVGFTSGPSTGQTKHSSLWSPSAISVSTGMPQSQQRLSNVFPLPRFLNPETPQTVKAAEKNELNAVNNDEALPWSTSISPTRTLTYMPLLKYTLDMIHSMGLEAVSIEEKLVNKASIGIRPARIGNLCFRSKEFRCVRLTYFDAGDAVQVFNTLWYPSFEYDVPLLGVDLISLGLNRVLNVIDFQPLHPTSKYAEKYIRPLSPIRSKYPDLHGVLSGKIYDDTSFFSKNMLFGRFTDESKIRSVVTPAFKDYLQAYVEVMKNCQPDNNPESMRIVRDRQQAYDIYSAAKDPAIGLFDAYFGKEWSKSLVHDFLFTMSSPPPPLSTQPSPLVSPGAKS